MKKYLYWIHRPNQTNLLSEGYIGVSKNPEKRLWEHKHHKRNPHLSNAFKKYKDITHTILLIGEENYCYEIEEKLRPTSDIGWNIVKGGGNPPSGKRKGATHSEASKQKMRQSLKGREGYWTGKTRPKCSDTHKQKTSMALKGKYVGEKSHGWGKPLSTEHKEKIRAGILRRRAA